MIAVIVVACLNQAAIDPNLNSLVNAEKAFARSAKRKGTRQAFLDTLSPDAVVFAPRPANGLGTWLNRNSPSLLEWWPTRAEVDRSGKFGYTTGPFQVSAKGHIIGRGTYLTIWSREKQPEWRVLLDVGISHKTVYGADRKTVGLEPSLPAKDRGTPAMADDQFWTDCNVSGSEQAYGRRLSERSVALIDGRQPSLNATTVAAGALAFPGKAQAQRAGWGIAPLRDLGYSYGTFKTASAEYGYVRVWRNENRRWRIAVEWRSLISPKS